MKKCIAIILALLLLCGLAACGGETENTDWVWVRDYVTYGTLSDTGYYYLRGSALCYADFAAGASAVLCAKAGCSHESESCDADIGGFNRPMYFYNDRLYYIDISQPILYSRDATGIDLKEVGTMGMQYIEEQKAVTIGNCAIAGGYLYYEADIYAQGMENGVSTARVERACIGRIDLSSGKDEILIDETYEKNSEKLILCAARANGVLLNRWEGIDKDREDPEYITALRTVPVTLEHWDGETGETTVLFRKTIGECSGIKMVSGGKVYYTAYHNAQSDDAGYTYSYDLNTGKEAVACPHRTRWHLGGAYVQCNDSDGNVFLYDMSAGKKLPYELDSVANVYNVSGRGYVMQLFVDAEDGGPRERRFYYVTLESLADGLQEADLQYLDSF